MGPGEVPLVAGGFPSPGGPGATTPFGQRKPMMDANWGAYRGPGMLPLGFFGQGPAGWNQWSQPARQGLPYGARAASSAAGSSYAPMSTGRLMGARTTP